MLSVVSFLLCLCAREGLLNFSSLLCDCITTRGGRHCIVGVWVKDHWWLLGTHHVIRSCCQSHDLVSRSNITMNGLMLNSSIIFTFGFRLRLWLTYAPCQMMFIRQESVVMKLHFNCHYECTIWIFYQVWFLRHAYCWYYIYHKHPFLCLLFCCPQPLCILGNSCLLGSTTGNQQWLNRLGSDQHHCEKHASTSVMCLPMRVGIEFWVVSLVYWNEVPQMGLTF